MQRNTWILSLFVLLLAMPIAAADGLSKALAHDTPVPEHLPHGKRYLHALDTEDYMGGRIKFSYDATVHHHVEVLDDWPRLIRVDCDSIAPTDSEGELILEGESALELAHRLHPGFILVGSAAWGCADSHGHVAPFYREVIASAVDSVTSDGTPRLLVMTAPSSFEACFSSISTQMSRSPGQFEREIQSALSQLQHSLHYNDTAGSYAAARRLQAVGRRRTFGWLSSAVSYATSAVTSTVSSVASAVSSGFSWQWGDSSFYERSLLKWNYDSYARKPTPRTTNLLGNSVQCKDCYGYIGANVKFNLQMDWWNLQEFEVSAYAGIVLGIDINIVSTDKLIDRLQTTSVQPQTKYPDISFSISGIPVTIKVQGKADVKVEASGAENIRITGPGFWIDNSVTAGVAYDKTSGWRLIKERTADMDSRKPGLDVTGDVSFKTTLMVEATFSLWGSWDIGVAVHPWMQLDLRPSRCSAADSVQITMQLGCDGQLTIGNPSVRLSLPRQCIAGACLGPYSMDLELPSGGYLPKTYDFAIKAGTTLSGYGLSGCVPSKSEAGSNAGFGSSSSASVTTDTSTSSSSSSSGSGSSYFDDDDDWSYGGAADDDDTSSGWGWWDDDDGSDDTDDWWWRRRLQAGGESQPAVCGTDGCSLHLSPWSQCSVVCGAGSQTREAECRTSGGRGLVVPASFCRYNATTGSPVSPPVLMQDCSSACLNLDPSGVIPFANTLDRAERRRLRHVLFPSGAQGVTLSTSNRYRGCFLLQEGDNAIDTQLHKLSGSSEMLLSLFGQAVNLAAETGKTGIGSTVYSYDTRISIILTQAQDGLEPGSRVYVYTRHMDPDDTVEFTVDATSFMLLEPGYPTQAVVKPLSAQKDVGPQEWPPGFAEAELPVSLTLCSDVDYTRPWLYDGTLEAMGYDSSTVDLTNETIALLSNSSITVDLNVSEVQQHFDNAHTMTGNASNTITANSPSRFFMLQPSGESVGVLMLASPASSMLGGTDDLAEFSFQCSYKDTDGWPSESSPGQWSGTQFGSGRVQNIIVKDDDFRPASLACAAKVAGVGSPLGIMGIEIRSLEPGQLHKGVVANRGYRIFRSKVSSTSSAVRIALRTLVGEADVYVNRRAFQSLPNRDYIWSSTAQLDVHEVIISNLDIYFSEELWIAVYGDASSEFEISLQAYERLEQGTTVSRALLPLSYNYFVGAPAENTGTATDAESSFNLRVQSPADAPATMAMYAGAYDAFFPVVRQGFSGIAVEGIAGGQVAAAERPYLEGSSVARQMIIATRSDFHDSTRPGDQFRQQGTSTANLGDSEDAARRRLSSSPEGPAGGPRGLSLSPPEDIAPTEDFALLYRDSLQGGGLQVSYPDIAWAPIGGGTTGPLTGGGSNSASAGSGGAAEEDARRLEVEAEAATGEAMARRLDAVLSAHAAQEEGPAPGVARAGHELPGTGMRPRALGEGESSSRFWTAGDAPSDVRGLHLASRLAAFDRSTAASARRLSDGDDDDWRFNVPLERFSNGRWHTVVNCSVAIGDFVARSCGLIEAAGTETVHLKLTLPARSDMYVSIAAEMPDGTAADAAYAIRVRANEPPAPGLADVEVSSSARTFSVPNCAYQGQELYASVDGQNTSPGGDAPVKPVQFRVLLAGTLSVGGICETFEWASTSWQPCDVECGVGTRRRAVWCQTKGGTVVESRLCNLALKPLEAERCDVGQCEWSETGWGACSEPCGGGQQARLLECRNEGGSGRLVLDAHCLDPPLSTRRCNTQACPDTFWFTGEWGACSKQCGLGSQTREVACAQSGPCVTVVDGRNQLCPGQQSLLWHPVNEGLCDRSNKPAAEQLCGREKCRELNYDLTYFDTESLVSGAATELLLAPGQSAFFTFEKPNAATRGVCLVAQSFEPDDRKCSVEAERRVGACNSALLGCLQAARDAGTDSSTTETPGSNSTTTNATTAAPVSMENAVISCHQEHIACVSTDLCNERVDAALVAAQVNCRESLFGIGVLSEDTWEEAEPVCMGGAAATLAAPSNAEPERELLLRVAKSGRSADDPVTRFTPPIDPQSSDWESQSPDRTGEQRMVIWETDGYDRDADRILVGLTAPTAGLKARLRVQALSAPPVQASGTFLGGSSGTVMAEQIRRGGLQLQLTLSCDIFVDPAVLVEQQRGRSGEDAISQLSESEVQARIANGTLSLGDVDSIRNAKAMTSRMLVLGITARESSAAGWNALAQPSIVYGDDNPAGSEETELVRFSFGMTRATLTLPPVPDYNPNGDETLQLRLPALMLRSGVETTVEGAGVTVLSDMADCRVGEWGPWSNCDEVCAQGTQARQRQVLRSPRGIGAACPITIERRECNTCDRCSTRNCVNGGLCIGGTCQCKPGYGGDGCEAPPRDPDAVYYYTVGRWGACSAECGGGVQMRELGCAVLGDAAANGASASLAATAPLDECIRRGDSAGSTPLDERPCNLFACDGEPRVDGSVVVDLPPAAVSLSLRDSDTSDGLLYDLRTDLSRSLFIADRRVRVDGMQLDAAASGSGGASPDRRLSSHGLAATAEHVRLNFTILPITAIASEAYTNPLQDDGGDGQEDTTADTADSEAGGLVATVVAELQRQTTDASSVLRTRGTFLRRLHPDSLVLQARQGVDGIAVPLASLGDFQPDASVPPAPSPSSTPYPTGVPRPSTTPSSGGGQESPAPAAPSPSAPSTNSTDGLGEGGGADGPPADGEEGGKNGTVVVVGLAAALGVVVVGLGVALGFLFLRHEGSATHAKKMQQAAASGGHTVSTGPTIGNPLNGTAGSRFESARMGAGGGTANPFDVGAAGQVAVTGGVATENPAYRLGPAASRGGSSAPSVEA